jgi:D-alanyl-D-alanine carboxypeptidase
MDAKSGAVLIAQDADDPLPPASMSMMMTEIIVLDAVSAGKVSWDDPIQAGSYAAEVEGAQIGFRAGERLTVRELFEAMVIHSANDAAVALAV